MTHDNYGPFLGRGKSLWWLITSQKEIFPVNFTITFYLQPTRTGLQKMTPPTKAVKTKRGSPFLLPYSGKEEGGDLSNQRQNKICVLLKTCAGINVMIIMSISHCTNTILFPQKSLTKSKAFVFSSFYAQRKKHDGYH